MLIENPQWTTTRNSPVESPILLWREIPMAWGTTIDSLNPEINPFLYARETKYLTLKDIDRRTLFQMVDIDPH